MTWSYSYKKILPDNCFAYLQGSTRKLPIFDYKGRLDLPHLRNALARLPLTDLPNEDIRAQLRHMLKKLLVQANAAAPARLTNKNWQPVTPTYRHRNIQARRNPDNAQRSERNVQQAVQHTLDVFSEVRALFARHYPWCEEAILLVHPLCFSPGNSQTFRDVAWAVPEACTVNLVQRACFFDDGRLWGLLAHELAHLADPQASEAQADELASQVIQMQILYDEDDLQNVLQGTPRRPNYLHA